MDEKRNHSNDPSSTQPIDEQGRYAEKPSLETQTTEDGAAGENRALSSSSDFDDDSNLMDFADDDDLLEFGEDVDDEDFFKESSEQKRGKFVKERILVPIEKLCKGAGSNDFKSIEAAFMVAQQNNPQFFDAVISLSEGLNVGLKIDYPKKKAKYGFYSDKNDINGGSYHNPLFNSVHLGKEALSHVKPRNDGQIASHEIGHWIDSLASDKGEFFASYGYKSEKNGGKTLYQMAQEELASTGVNEMDLFWDIIDERFPEMGEDVKAYFKAANELNNLPKTISWGSLASEKYFSEKGKQKVIATDEQWKLVNKVTRAFNQFSDLYEATRKSKQNKNHYGPIGYGHKKSYFQDDRSCATEVFADISAIKNHDSETYAIMQKRMPKTLAIYEEILQNAIIKGKKGWPK